MLNMLLILYMAVVHEQFVIPHVHRVCLQREPINLVGFKRLTTDSEVAGGLLIRSETVLNIYMCKKQSPNDM